MPLPPLADFLQGNTKRLSAPAALPENKDDENDNENYEAPSPQEVATLYKRLYK